MPSNISEGTLPPLFPLSPACSQESGALPCFLLLVCTVYKPIHLAAMHNAFTDNQYLVLEPHCSLTPRLGSTMLLRSVLWRAQALTAQNQLFTAAHGVHDASSAADAALDVDFIFAASAGSTAFPDWAPS